MLYHQFSDAGVFQDFLAPIDQTHEVRLELLDDFLKGRRVRLAVQHELEDIRPVLVLRIVGLSGAEHVTHCARR